MKNKRVIVLILIVIFIVVALTYTRWNGSVKKGLAIEATGMIEALEVDISPKIPERIEWLCCKEGDRTTKGMILVRLDKREITAKADEINAMLKGAEAGYNVSLSNYENAETKIERANAEIKAAEYEIERATALFEDARDNFNRITELFKQGYAAKKDLDTVKTAYNATNAQLNAALSKKHSLEADRSAAGANLKTSTAQVTSARVNIKEAEARLRLAGLQIKDTEVSSPIDGVVAYKYFEEGEMASPGKTILTIYDTKNLWARIDIEETNIGKIRLGEKAVITAESVQNKTFDGEVTEISREAEFATQRDVTRGRQDIKTFRIKTAIKDNEGELKPGMTVRVRFESVNGKW
ncbi:MAG: efflux RND transporter periplasmic adaptor subunit [Nitrospirae bacterium]|nr:efflux RND transporter periplasmic adaptor subunit [Nitrospirota bacterium]